MKNNKFAKALTALGLGAMMTASVFGMAACDPDNGGTTPPDNGHTHDYKYVSDGENGHHQECKDGDDVKGIEAHVYDNDEDTTCNKCDYVREIGGQEEGNAIVPEYKGPAAGPSSEAQDVEYKLNGADIPVGTLSEAWTDGTFTISSGAELRNRTPSGDGVLPTYTRSIKNGTITVNVPAAGKLKFAFSSGSSGGGAKYKITGPGQEGNDVEIMTGDKVLNVVEIDVTQGTYVFSKANGTVDVYEVLLKISAVAPAPIESVEITSAGTTAYLITQKVDCTGVQLIAKDGNGVTHDVSLDNCEFDTSNYKPNQTGEYEISVTYHLESNLGSQTKDFKATYTVKVYAVDSITLDLIGLSNSKQVTAKQAYLTTDTYVKETNITVMAVCDYNGDKINYKLKNSWYNLTDTVDLTTAGTKTVEVKVDTKYTVGNKEVKASYEIISAAKKEVQNNKVTVTVGNSGDFKTVTQAVQYLSNYEDGVDKVIEIAAGTYEEKVWIDVPNVTLIGKGADKDDTVITCSLVEGDMDNYSGTLWALNCATVHVTGANFKAYNLAIRNDFDYIANSGKYSGSQAAQGVALTLDADEAVLYNCHLYGNQDTLYFKSGRSYYYKTQIDGNIDFIFGSEHGLAFFEECKIVAISRNNSTQNGYVTAAQHKEGTKPDYGYIFYKCELTDDGKVADGSMSLGRPWGAVATIAYIECSFSKAYSTKAYGDSSVKTHRWESMSGAEPANADFCEYGSTGEGAISSAVAGGKLLTQEQAANYTKANIFAAKNGKQTKYTAVYDCDAALAALKALAGLN